MMTKFHYIDAFPPPPLEWAVREERVHEPALPSRRPPTGLVFTCPGTRLLLFLATSRFALYRSLDIFLATQPGLPPEHMT